MQITRNRELIPVPKGSLLSLGTTQQIEISCESGVLWITQDNDVRDIVLSAGERFTSDRVGRVLVHALQPTVMTATSLAARGTASVAGVVRPFGESLRSSSWFGRLFASLDGRQPVTE